MEAAIYLMWGLSILAVLAGLFSIASALGSVAAQINLLRERLEAQMKKTADKGTLPPVQRMGESDDDYNRRLFRFQVTGRNDS